MSHGATNWAIQQRGLKPTTKIVLWHLCDRFNPDYGCFPAQDRLAHDCEISRATLNTHLGLLEQGGLLRRERRVDPRTRRQLSTRYILGFEDGFTPVPQGPGGAARTSCGSDDQIPCPDSGHGPEPENPNFDSDLSVEFPDPPCLDSGHGAVSRNEPEPCPEKRESRVQNLDTNLVREPLREPVKEEEDAQARDAGFDDVFAELLGALGLDPARLPGWWQGAPPRTHVRRWIDHLGLTEDQILEVATETRRDHPEPPDGPKALDRAMQRAARRQTGHGTAARRPGESMCDSRSGRSAPAGARPSAEAKAAFYAQLVNSDRFLPSSMISNTIRDAMLASGLVSAARLRERGVA